MIDRNRCPECTGTGKPVVCYLCCNLDGTEIVKTNNEASVFSYREVMRSPDDKIGQNYTVSGTVKSIEKMYDGVYKIILKHTSDEIDYEFNLRYFSQAHDTKVLAGDMISAYGTFVSYDKDDIPSFVVVELTIEN